MNPTKEIQHALCKMLVGNGHHAVCENFGYHCGEMDVVSMSKSGALREYEIKVSRADFKADKKKKTKHIRYGQSDNWYAPNYFTYVCPDGLIKEAEVPEYSGLWYYSNGEFDVIKESPRIHKYACDRFKVITKMLRLNIERKYLGASFVTVRERKKKERNALLLSQNNTL